MVNRGKGRATGGLGTPYTLPLSTLPVTFRHYAFQRPGLNGHQHVFRAPVHPGDFLFPCLKKSSHFARFLPKMLTSLGGKKANRTGSSCLVITMGRALLGSQARTKCKSFTDPGHLSWSKQDNNYRAVVGHSVRAQTLKLDSLDSNPAPATYSYTALVKLPDLSAISFLNHNMRTVAYGCSEGQTHWCMQSTQDGGRAM